ncbi:hypothetical protein KFL_000220110 [Klebsormidium nitens]|uniref:Uncharacterized protein n=1 Tax=Klebsormidium nitens TaxID=105231 RepID=A0A1Y1HK85_KLENI|nr:hypothetical protein KFL_000220110 [Klebsormidium nitens]|eukprot:GAQ78980.1 hypothetical protein KFL_000220110 [Klebsormidium nitens]
METEEKEAQRILSDLPFDLQKRFIDPQSLWRRKVIMKQGWPQLHLGFATKTILELCRMLGADNPNPKYAKVLVSDARDQLKKSRSELVSADDVAKGAESFQVVIEVVVAMDKCGVREIATYFANYMALTYAKVLLGFLFSTEDLEGVWRFARDLDQLALLIDASPGTKHSWQSYAKAPGEGNRETQPPLTGFGSCLSMLENLLVALESTAGLTSNAAPLNGDELREWGAALDVLGGEIVWLDSVQKTLQWDDLQRDGRLLLDSFKREGMKDQEKRVAPACFKRRWLCCGPTATKVVAPMFQGYLPYRHVASAAKEEKKEH